MAIPGLSGDVPPEVGPAAYAHTNLGLYRQLQAAGYAPADLERCRRAYALAAHLFSARFRPSHDTFLSHLVGTASLLAALRAPGAVVAAGLLHAAYREGDFGSGAGGVGAADRAEVRRALGAGAERLVARYATLAWSAAAIAELSARFDALPPLDRDVLLMRLANALEDHAEGGVLHGADAERRRAYLRGSAATLVELARRLGQARLARELEAAFRETLEGTARPGVDGGLGPTRTYVLPPRSYALRWSAGARSAARVVARALRKRLGRPRPPG